MKIRGIVRLAAPVAVGVMMLAACGGGEGSNDGADKNPAADSANVEAPAAEPVDKESIVKGWPAVPLGKKSLDSLIQVLEDPKRAEWQNPDMVLTALGRYEGKVVADIGAGTGYFSFPIAEKAEKVIAIDIDQGLIDYIEDKKASSGTGGNIETRLAETSSPGLADGEADIALFVNTYSQIRNRAEYLANLKKGLKEGGAIIVVDLYKYSDTRKIMTGPPANRKLKPETVEAELKAAGFEKVRMDEKSLIWQYIVKAM